jgi:hypothetical protein
MFKTPGLPLSMAVSETKGAFSPTPIRIAMLKSADRQGALDDEVSGTATASPAKASARSLKAILPMFRLMAGGVMNRK